MPVRRLWGGDLLLGGLGPLRRADAPGQDIVFGLRHVGGAPVVGGRLRHRWRLSSTAGPAGPGVGVVGVAGERQHATTLWATKGVASHTVQIGGPHDEPPVSERTGVAPVPVPGATAHQRERLADHMGLSPRTTPRGCWRRSGLLPLRHSELPPPIRQSCAQSAQATEDQ